MGTLVGRRFEDVASCDRRLTDVAAPGPSSRPPPGTRPGAGPYTARWPPAFDAAVTVAVTTEGALKQARSVLRRDAEALALTRGGRDLADAGEGADHLLVGGLREFLEPLQVGGGDQGDEGLAVPCHNDALYTTRLIRSASSALACVTGIS